MSVVVDLLFIVTSIVGVCNCSLFCCTLLYVPSSFAIILMGKRKLIALLSLSSWCLVISVLLFLAVPQVCLQFVIVVFPDHTHLLFFLVKSHRWKHYQPVFLWVPYNFTSENVTPYTLHLGNMSRYFVKTPMIVQMTMTMDPEGPSDSKTY